MIRVKRKKIILVLLMLVFSIQVVASANVTCHHKTSSSEASMHVMPSTMVDHTQHLNLASSADATTEPDCDCNVGDCSNSAIVSVPQLLTSLDIFLVSGLYSEIFESKLTFPSLRPPVSR